MEEEEDAPAAGGGRLVGEYILGPRIGSGSFSVVWRARHRQSGAEVAVKEIGKRHLSGKVRESLMKEITILRHVAHPNIVGLHEAIQTEDRIFLVLEHCAGGDLAAYIQRRGRVSAGVARHFMRQLASGLQILRDNNLIHRDLKPQNLLLSTNEETPVLKIGDFGFARYLMPQGLADTLCGSPLYMAPEIIQNKPYDSKADLWSVGAILFQLVTGKPPFDGNSQFQLFQNILTSNEPQFPQDVLADLHPDCIDLCRSLLRHNPVERLKFEDFFNHKFLAMPRTSGSTLDGVQNTGDDNLGGSLNHGQSNSLHVRSIMTGGMDQGLLIASSPKVSDSLESIEREYVLVNAHYASMATSSPETSLQDNSTTRFTSYIQKKIGNDTAGLMQTGELVVSSVFAVESMGSHVSVPLSSVSQASIKSEEVQGITGISSHPSSRLQFLYQYVCALTELAQEKLVEGLHVESFSIELVALALWKEALRVCNFWMASSTEMDAHSSSSANDCLIHRKNDNTSVDLTEGVDFMRPLSVCSWAGRGFIVAYDRAEKISNSFQDIGGSVEMPDAMEIIYQTALSVGKSGAVNELMGHWSEAVASYSKAITLLSFLVVEATSLPFNPPFLLSLHDRQRIHTYIVNLRARLNQSRQEQPPIKPPHDFFSK